MEIVKYIYLGVAVVFFVFLFISYLIRKYFVELLVPSFLVGLILAGILSIAWPVVIFIEIFPPEGLEHQRPISSGIQLIKDFLHDIGIKVS